MTSIEELAGTLLREAGVKEPPVPIEKIARDHGALISYQPFDADDISGLLYRSADSAPVIGVNSSNSKVRQRFTVAHELGHLLLHEGRDLILERLVRVNFRDATSSTATDEEEIDANRFAAEVLMPRPLLERSLSVLLRGRSMTDGELVQRLATRFEVSQQSMEFRMASLGMLTPS